jgi:antitoxin (DNA-binding transcriptional repressor) of toxin-antitoxin stability system
MTTNLNLPESYEQFTNIIERVRHEEEIIIYSAGNPVAKISPIIEANKKPRVPGLGKGRMIIHSDFDDPLTPDVLDGFLNPAIQNCDSKITNHFYVSTIISFNSVETDRTRSSK